MENPTKIIIVDRSRVTEEAAEFFGISLDKVEHHHTAVIIKLFRRHSGCQWTLAKERMRKD